MTKKYVTRQSMMIYDSLEENSPNRYSIILQPDVLDREFELKLYGFYERVSKLHIIVYPYKRCKCATIDINDDRVAEVIKTHFKFVDIGTEYDVEVSGKDILDAMLDALYKLDLLKFVDPEEKQ